MSYPEPVYHGEWGEVSAFHVPAGKPADLTIGTTMQTRYLATQVSTNGRLGLYRVDMGPEQAGPGPHFHRTMSEAFFILSGVLRLFDGDQWIDGTSGDFFYVPEGGVHAFRKRAAGREVPVKVRGSTGSQCRVVNTRPERVHARLAAVHARSCIPLHCRNAATHTGGRGSVASDTRVLVPVQQLAADRCSCQPMISSAASRSTSSQARPRTSPLRRPSARISTYAAYSLSRVKCGLRPLRSLGGPVRSSLRCGRPARRWRTTKAL